MTADEEKGKIREAMRFKLKMQAEKERLNKSRKIMEKIFKMEPFQRAKTVMFYHATDEEVATQELIEEAFKTGKRVVLPYINEAASEVNVSFVENLNEDLARGSYDIMEPKPEKRKKVELNEIDLVLVPGLAFDREGHRLGRGKGYYDRFLKILPAHVKRYGLAFDFQVLDQVPVNDSDVLLDLIVTNE